MDDDKENLLRNGFGFFAAAEQRGAAQAYINELSANKMWVACDCMPPHMPKPQLWPVTGASFRRNRGEGALTHGENCEFAHPPHRAQDVRSSFTAKVRSNGLLKFRLARGFFENAERAAPGLHNVNRVNRSTPRPGLARLLAEVLTLAGVQEIQPNDHYPNLPMLTEAMARIRRAAVSIEIAQGKLLSDWLAVGMTELSGLKRKIERSNADDWGSSRPHGILICNVHEVQRHQLIFEGARIPPEPILGRVAVFGEKEALGRHPYLVACLVGKASPQDKEVSLLRAYAHPCLSWSKWTLVDSNLERETINRIQGCRWSLGKNDIQFEVHKPLFDCNTLPEDDFEPVCLPDFLIKLPSRRARTIVVETMGYKDTRYRNRKETMEPHFRRIGLDQTGKEAILAHHDRFQTPAVADPDKIFGRQLRRYVLEALAEIEP